MAISNYLFCVLKIKKRKKVKLKRSNFTSTLTLRHLFIHFTNTYLTLTIWETP